MGFLTPKSSPRESKFGYSRELGYWLYNSVYQIYVDGILTIQAVFTLEENNKGIRGHSLKKIAKLRCSRDYWKHFFQTGQSTGGMGWISRRLGPLASMFFKNRLVMIRNKRTGFFMA